MRRKAVPSFLKAGIAYYAILGVTLQRVMTDNGSCYLSVVPASGASASGTSAPNLLFGWQTTSIIDLDRGGHAGRKDDARRYLIDMDANRDALSQAHPGE